MVEDHENFKKPTVDETLRYLTQKIENLQKENETLKLKVNEIEKATKNYEPKGKIVYGNIETLSPEEKNLLFHVKIRETPLKEIVKFDLDRKAVKQI